MNFSFQKIFFAIATAFSIFAILILAKPVLFPLSIALLLSFILLPLAKKIELWGLTKILSGLISVFVALSVVGGIIFFFSTQISDITQDFSQFQSKILGAFADITLYLNENMRVVPHLEKNELSNEIKDWLYESKGSLARQTVTSTAGFFRDFIATVVFTFLFLIYRSELTKALTLFYDRDKRDQALNMFKAIQKVGQKYLLGMILMISILSVVNSTGLWIIGMDYPLLFGLIAGILAIIPYIGTITGAAIAILYALVTSDTFWMPLAVAIFFWVVQFIETNYLSPKIVGGSLKMNALTAILSIIIGGYVWGVAGMILFMPFTAILKVICQNYPKLKPVAILIDSHGDKGSGDLADNIKNGLFKMINKFRKGN